MSGESSLHSSLVERLIAVVTSRHSAPRGMLVLADHHDFGDDRPPQIGGFTPDVFACDVPETFRVLGEAKTPGDLESERSLRQIAAFLDHLSLRAPSTLYVAVPWRFVPRAQGIVRSLRRESHARVHVHVIADIG